MRARTLMLAMTGLVAGGCKHLPPEGAGTSSFRVVAPPAIPQASGSRGSVEPVSTAQYREAELEGDPVLPVYPARALAARAGGVQIGVHLVIDAQGLVSEIRPSMVAVTLVPAEFADDFQRAVEAAVQQWRFEPARIEQIETVTGDNGFTYRRVRRNEPTEAEVDLAFAFTPGGKVQAGAARK